MLCYRAVDSTADEEGGGRDEYNEMMALRKTVGGGGRVATVSQQTKTIRKDYGF